MPVGPTRRAVLAASAAAVPFLISGCRGIQVLGTPAAPAPDVRQLRAAITAEQQLISRYHAVLAGSARNTGAAQPLSALLAEHEQHLAQLRSRLIVPAGSAQSVPASSVPGGSGAAGPAAMPADLASALGALVADEQAAAGRLAAQLLESPPPLAQLLASISASEATHVPVLSQLRRTA